MEGTDTSVRVNAANVAGLLAIDLRSLSLRVYKRKEIRIAKKRRAAPIDAPRMRP
jgi:hypothetical protein